jgi:hypothetical protein
MRRADIYSDSTMTLPPFSPNCVKYILYLYYYSGFILITVIFALGYMIAHCYEGSKKMTRSSRIRMTGYLLYSAGKPEPNNDPPTRPFNTYEIE